MTNKVYARNPTPINLIAMWQRIKKQPERIKIMSIKGIQGRPLNPKQLELFL